MGLSKLVTNNASLPIDLKFSVTFVLQPINSQVFTNDNFVLGGQCVVFKLDILLSSAEF